MKNDAIIVISGLILNDAFVFLIYPTPYKYMKYEDAQVVPRIKRSYRLVCGRALTFVVPKLRDHLLFVMF